MFKVNVTWRRRYRYPPLYTFTLEEHEDRGEAMNAMNVFVSAWSRELKENRPVEVFVEDERGERISGYNLQEMPEAEEDPAAAVRKKYPQGVETWNVYAETDEAGRGAPVKAETLELAEDLARTLCGVMKKEPGARVVVETREGAVVEALTPADVPERGEGKE